MAAAAEPRCWAINAPQRAISAVRVWAVAEMNSSYKEEEKKEVRG